MKTNLVLFTFLLFLTSNCLAVNIAGSISANSDQTINIRYKVKASNKNPTKYKIKIKSINDHRNYLSQGVGKVSFGQPIRNLFTAEKPEILVFNTLEAELKNNGFEISQDSNESIPEIEINVNTFFLEPLFFIIPQYNYVTIDTDIFIHYSNKQILKRRIVSNFENQGFIISLTFERALQDYYSKLIPALIEAYDIISKEL